jgi:hypothetical protein
MNWCLATQFLTEVGTAVLVKKAKNIFTLSLGYHGIDLTKRLGLSESGVVLAARRGEALYE